MQSVLFRIWLLSPRQCLRGSPCYMHCSRSFLVLRCSTVWMGPGVLVHSVRGVVVSSLRPLGRALLRTCSYQSLIIIYMYFFWEVPTAMCSAFEDTGCIFITLVGVDLSSLMVYQQTSIECPLHYSRCWESQREQSR